MITLFILLATAAAIISGKKIDKYVKSFKGFDWKAIAAKLWNDLTSVAIKIGRRLTGMLLEMWYVLCAEETPLTDKILIYAAFIYLVSPLNLMPMSIYKVFGVADETAAIGIVYNRVSKNITPDISEKARQTLNDWFGYEVEIVV